MTSTETAAAITSAVIIAVGAPATLFHREIARELRAIRDKFAPHPPRDPDRAIPPVDRPSPSVDQPSPTVEPPTFPKPAFIDPRPTPASPVSAFKPDPFKLDTAAFPVARKEPPAPALKKDGTPKKKPGPKPKSKAQGRLTRPKQGRKAA